MTRFLQERLSQPDELLCVIYHLNSPGRKLLESVADAICSARHVSVYLTAH